MPYRRRFTATVTAAAAAAALLATPGRAQAEQRTWNYLTSGNGHGFSVYDANKSRVVQFLEHPYRYLRPNPTDDKQEGVGRRNLAYDVYFGLKAGGGSGWLSEVSTSDSPELVDQAGIIRAPASVGGVQAESFFFMPFGIERNVLVGVLHAPGASDGYALLNFHMGYPGGSGGTEPDATGESVRYAAGTKAVIETGPGGGAMIYVSIGGLDGSNCNTAYDTGKSGGDYGQQTGCNRSGDDIAVGLQKKLDGGGWMGFAAGFVENAADADTVANEIVTFLAGRTADKVLDDTKKEWESWRKPPPNGILCSDDEKKVWRTGEAILRMGQVREANIPGQRMNHGMILASLPVGEWHTGWVRDATYAIVGLARSGHVEEAKAALDFFMNAEPVGRYPQLVHNQPYRISLTRYYGTGEEESDWNQQGYNPELDGWGLVLWAARAYVEASGDTAWLDSQTRDGSVWSVLTGGIAGPLEANLEPNGIVTADTSIWEVHEANKKHFAYTTLAAARGFCDMAGIAKKANKPDVQKYADLAKKVRDGFLGAFVDDQGGLAGSLEELGQGKYLDGAVAEAFTWNVLDDWKGNTAKQTLTLLEKLRVDSGGYKRNDDGLSSYDNNEWILVDLRIANAYRRSGNTAKADGIVANIVQKATANFYLLPELYNAVQTDGQIGRYTGSIPMVGYGGGTFVSTILDRAGIGTPDDCGDGKGSVLPKVDCSSVSTNPGNPDGPGGPNGPGGPGDNGGPPGADEIPFVPACLCHAGARGRLSPAGVALFLALPLTVFLRRRSSARRK